MGSISQVCSALYHAPFLGWALVVVLALAGFWFLRELDNGRIV